MALNTAVISEDMLNASLAVIKVLACTGFLLTKYFLQQVRERERDPGADDFTCRNFADLT